MNVRNYKDIKEKFNYSCTEERVTENWALIYREMNCFDLLSL